MIIVHTPTNNLQGSIEYYQKLNYKMISTGPETRLTDGKAIIEINPDRFARAGVKIFRSSWAIEIQRLTSVTNIHQIEDGFLINDFNGCWIYLIEGDAPDIAHASESSGLTGDFQGVSLESSDLAKSFEVWEILGFQTVMGSVEQGMLILKHEGGFTVSLMKPLSCPHLFFNPSLTFFNGKDNLAIIDNIRKTGIPIAEEITHFNEDGIVDNIIIRDPGGYGMFLFND